MSSSDPTERQCLGRTGPFYSRRCGRRTPNWFCRDHRLQLLVIPLLLVPAALSYFDGAVSAVEYLTGPSREQIAFQRDALTRASLIAHQWKLHFYDLHADALNTETAGDLWDDLQAVPLPNYSEEVWVRFRPLFAQRINYMVGEFETLLSTHGDALPVHVRLRISQMAVQLRTDQTLYVTITPRVATAFPDQAQALFTTAFREVPRELGELDREVQRLRDAL